MLTISKISRTTPAEAGALAEQLTKNLSGDALHRAFDQVSNEILASLGYFEFVAAFTRATEGYHGFPVMKHPATARTAFPDLMRIGLSADVVIATGLDDREGAAFSRCEQWRWLLWRVWDWDAPFWGFGMLNPSTADHRELDPTIRRCCRFAKDGGAGGLIVWNLFAWRDTKPENMKRAKDPVGSENDRVIRRALAASSRTICAWGVHGRHLGREQQVLDLMTVAGVSGEALGFNADGTPKHPLYISAETAPRGWPSE